MRNHAHPKSLQRNIVDFGDCLWIWAELRKSRILKRRPAPLRTPIACGARINADFFFIGLFSSLPKRSAVASLRSPGRGTRIECATGTSFRMPPQRRRSIGAAEIQHGQPRDSKSAPIRKNPRSGRIGVAGGLIRDFSPPPHHTELQ